MTTFSSFIVNENGVGWLAQLACYILIGIFLNTGLWFGLRYLDRQYQPDRALWPHAFLQAIYRPLWVLIWLIMISLIAEAFLLKWPQGHLLNDLITSQKMAIIVFIGWGLLRFINQYESNVYDAIKAGRLSYDRTSVRAVSQFLRIVLIVSAVLVILQTIGVKISALLAVSGLGGIALSFAAKDNLANLLGGMMIFIDRPFSVGDWIRSPDRNIEGTVESIGWRLTLVRTFDKRPLYVPNGVFSTISIENPSRMTNRRIYAKIGLRYSDSSKVASILSGVESMLQQHEAIDTQQTLMVNLIEFAESSLVFFVYTFTKTTDWQEFQQVQQDVFLKILDIIHQHGAECAFPTTTLHVANPLTITKH